MGVCSNGGLRQTNIPQHTACGSGLQSWWEHRLQVSRRKPSKPEPSDLLRQRLSGLQRPQVGGVKDGLGLDQILEVEVSPKYGVCVCF